MLAAAHWHARRLLHRPSRLALACFALVSVVSWWLRALNLDNVNSKFFDAASARAQPDRLLAAPRSEAIARDAARWRQAQEERLRAAAQRGSGEGTESASQNSVAVGASAGRGPPLAVVLLTHARLTGQTTLDVTLASLLAPLSREDRGELHVSVLFADERPWDNPAWWWAWLHDAVDEVVVRRSADDTEDGAHLPPRVPRPARVRTLAFPGYPPRMPTHLSSAERKATIDYISALDVCRHVSPAAEYCMVVEDDVVVDDAWLPQLRRYLDEAERGAWHPCPSAWTVVLRPLRWISARLNSARAGRRRAGGERNWAFIRLFWAEKYFGWEDYEVPGLVRFCAGSTAAFAVVAWLALFRRSASRGLVRPASSRPKPKHSPSSSANLEMQPPQPASPTSPTSFDGAVTSALHGRPSSRPVSPSSLSSSRPPLASLAILTTTWLSLVLLLILANRDWLLPPRGLSHMPWRGCCTQAVVLPNARSASGRGDAGASGGAVGEERSGVERARTFLYAHAGAKPYDVLLADWANGRTHGYPHVGVGGDTSSSSSLTPGVLPSQLMPCRDVDAPPSSLCEPAAGHVLAVTPSLVQHLGGGGGSSLGHARDASQPLWSFAFERVRRKR